MAEAKKVLILKDFNLPKEHGDHHRLMIMTGPKKGDSYFLKEQRVVIGRGDKVDIHIPDTNLSRDHLEIVHTKNGYVLTDLNSQNGVIVNRDKVTQHTLFEGDKIIIGQTVMRYNRIKIDEPSIKTVSVSNSKLKEKSNKVVLLLIVALLILFFLEDSGESQNKFNYSRANKKILSDVTNEFLDEENRKISRYNNKVRGDMKIILQQGLREAREENYFRALNYFESAKTLSPNDSRASFYIKKTTTMLKNEIEQNILKAEKDMESLKYNDAIISYCAVIRLLDAVSLKGDYTQVLEDTNKRLRLIEEKTGYEKNEIKCI